MTISANSLHDAERFDKMKSAYKEVWVDALRSGKYQQAIGMLRSQSNAMCCLGVLCDVTDHKRWRLDEGLNQILQQQQPSDTNKTQTPWGYTTGDIAHDDDDWDKTHEVLEEGELPEDVMNEVGITSDSMHQLIKLNDEEKASFEEITQFIEEYL